MEVVGSVSLFSRRSWLSGERETSYLSSGLAASSFIQEYGNVVKKAKSSQGSLATQPGMELRFQPVTGATRVVRIMGKRAAAVLLVVLQAEVLVVAGVGTLQQVVLHALGAQLGRAARRRDRQDQSGHPGALSAEVC